MAFAAVVLIVLGLVCWALYRFAATGERHSFTPGSISPAYVHLTAGETYSLGVRGGVDELKRQRIDLTTLSCSFAPRGGSAEQLAITAERPETKATNQVATFVAPVTGRAHVECAGVTDVFVDDADDTSADLSGLWLVLASIALAIGLPLLFSVMRTASGRPREEHEVE